ncbi:DUF2948 family protein [Pseudooceanicola sp. C21-150M6]|uniref:DUF2948 family protein n=1 Tax=Pseudooceanicola sp. C21-150M6 TaxID=3434355 RepID=UPI003D7FC1BD
MTQGRGDATFEDGREAPLNLGAEDAADVQIISALMQDSVFTLSEVAWQSRRQRFSLLVNRLRWEDAGEGRHGVERVQSVLSIETVRKVSSMGFDRRDSDLVLSILSVTFEPGEAPPGGAIVLTLAGDGEIRMEVEAPQMVLRDVTRPYLAPSGKRPDHG